jgi:2-polyprenyl-3-methyl-5-hydroxy-6-metoxy-1,4-benzoquinol methylase
MRRFQYQLTPTTSRCPVCYSEQSQSLYSVDSEHAAQHYVLAEADGERHARLKAHIERLWGQASCALMQCRQCNFCFAQPFVAGDARFYELAYQRTGYPGWKWEYERTLQTLRELTNDGVLNNFSLLEVGAGDGAFVKSVAPDLTTKARVLCTEYSDFGRSAIESYGVECRGVDVRQISLDAQRGRFNVVCMFQILEHMDRLDELFHQLIVLTDDRAHLFIAVPNEKRIEFNELHGSLLDLPPNHLGRWNRKCFQIIGQRHGWREIAYEIEPEGFASKLKQYVKYRYLLKSQHRSMANRIERSARGRLLRPLQAAAAALYAAGAFREIHALLTTDGIGDSQWVHLQRQA